VAEERLMELRSRGIAVPPVPWRTNGVVLAAVFFVLTVAAAIAAWMFLEEITGDNKLSSWILAVVSLAFAEYLIRRHHFFGTGVESALWLIGLFCAIFGLPGRGAPEALLLFAAASAIAGLRVRNPLFGALAVIFILSYLDRRAADEWQVVFALGSAGAALGALHREWRRPSTEMLFVALLVIPPLALFEAIGQLSPWWAVVFAIFVALCLLAGFRLRHHAPFIAAGVNAVLAVAILAANELLPFEYEWQLITGGVFLLFVSAVVTRHYRDRTRGIVVTPSALTKFDEELQILGTVGFQPRVEVGAAQPQGGGSFGGGGATGDY
jgi:hypothetical protein